MIIIIRPLLNFRQNFHLECVFFPKRMANLTKMYGASYTVTPHHFTRTNFDFHFSANPKEKYPIKTFKNDFESNAVK